MDENAHDSYAQVYPTEESLYVQVDNKHIDQQNFMTIKYKGVYQIITVNG